MFLVFRGNVIADKFVIINTAPIIITKVNQPKLVQKISLYLNMHYFPNSSYAANLAVIAMK